MFAIQLSDETQSIWFFFTFLFFASLVLFSVSVLGVLCVLSLFGNIHKIHERDIRKRHTQIAKNEHTQKSICVWREQKCTDYNTSDLKIWYIVRYIKAIATISLSNIHNKYHFVSACFLFIFFHCFVVANVNLH